MTATHATAAAAPTAVERAEHAILRTLADADGSPVPLTDLDGTSTARTIATALALLTRAGVVDIAAGHIGLAPAHPHKPAVGPPTRPEPARYRREFPAHLGRRGWGRHVRKRIGGADGED